MYQIELSIVVAFYTQQIYLLKNTQKVLKKPSEA